MKTSEINPLAYKPQNKNLELERHSLCGEHNLMRRTGMAELPHIPHMIPTRSSCRNRVGGPNHTANLRSHGDQWEATNPHGSNSYSSALDY